MCEIVFSDEAPIIDQISTLTERLKSADDKTLLQLLAPYSDFCIKTINDLINGGNDFRERWFQAFLDAGFYSHAEQRLIFCALTKLNIQELKRVKQVISGIAG